MGWKVESNAVPDIYWILIFAAQIRSPFSGLWCIIRCSLFMFAVSICSLLMMAPTSVTLRLCRGSRSFLRQPSFSFSLFIFALPLPRYRASYALRSSCSLLVFALCLWLLRVSPFARAGGPAASSGNIYTSRARTSQAFLLPDTRLSILTIHEKHNA